SAAGARARATAGSRCAPSWYARSSTITCRGRAFGTPLTSCAGAGTSPPPSAPSSSSTRRRPSSWRPSSSRLGEAARPRLCYPAGTAMTAISKQFQSWSLALLLLLMSLAIFVSTFWEDGYIRDMRQSASSMYDDRLTPATDLFYLSDHLYSKRWLL